MPIGESRHAPAASMMADTEPAAPAELDAARIREALHDLRTPLQALMLALEDMVDGQPLPTGTRVVAASALARIDALLGRGAARHPAAFDPGALFAELGRLLAPIARADGTLLRVEAPTGLPAVQGDEVLLFRIVQNLAANALKAAAGGEVGIFVRRIPDTGPEQVGLHITVQDSGPGLSADQRAWLTEGSSPTPPTGLGLGIVRDGLAKLGGRILPGAGPGIAFCLTLPRATLLHAAPQAEDEPMPDLTGLRVLLAEDDPLTRELMSSRLHRWGVGLVETVARGADLRQRLAAPGPVPDLVLADLDLSDMTLADALAPLGRLPEGLNLVVLTGADAGEARNQDIPPSAREILHKPLPAATLQRIVRDTSRRMPAHRMETAAMDTETQTLDPQVTAELFDELGADAAFGFIERALAQVQALLDAPTPASTSPLHSAIGACAVTGLRQLEMDLRRLHGDVKHEKDPKGSVASLERTLNTTRMEIERLKT